MEKKSFAFKGRGDVEVVSVVDGGQRWYFANLFAELMGYTRANDIVCRQVKEENARILETFDVLAGFGHPLTKLLNSHGILDLVRFSASPSKLQVLSFIETVFEFYAEKLPEVLRLRSAKFLLNDKDEITFVYIKDGEEKWYLAKTLTETLEIQHGRKSVSFHLNNEKDRTTLEKLAGHRIIIEDLPTKTTGKFLTPSNHTHP
jgi:prophage antirepressor-like protein